MPPTRTGDADPSPLAGHHRPTEHPQLGDPVVSAPSDRTRALALLRSAYGLDSAAPARPQPVAHFQPLHRGAFSTGAEGCIFDRP